MQDDSQQNNIWGQEEKEMNFNFWNVLTVTAEGKEMNINFLSIWLRDNLSVYDLPVALKETWLRSPEISIFL